MGQKMQWPLKAGGHLIQVNLLLKWTLYGHKILTFKWECLFNRGDYIHRFDCTLGCSTLSLRYSKVKVTKVAVVKRYDQAWNDPGWPHMGGGGLVVSQTHLWFIKMLEKSHKNIQPLSWSYKLFWMVNCNRSDFSTDWYLSLMILKEHFRQPVHVRSPLFLLIKLLSLQKVLDFLQLKFFSTDVTFTLKSIVQDINNSCTLEVLSMNKIFTLIVQGTNFLSLKVCNFTSSGDNTVNHLLLAMPLFGNFTSKNI